MTAVSFIHEKSVLLCSAPIKKMLYDYADGKRKILFVYFYDSTATEYLAGTGRYMM
jgi:hypothetical protein